MVGSVQGGRRGTAASPFRGVSYLFSFAHAIAVATGGKAGMRWRWRGLGAGGGNKRAVLFRRALFVFKTSNSRRREQSFGTNLNA